MTYDETIQKTTQQLDAEGIETARLDALLLLSDVTKKDKSYILAYPEQELTLEQYNQLEKLVARRMNHEPLAYIRGISEFYGREFVVNKHVLVPRPESETMIDLLKAVVAGSDLVARSDPATEIIVVDVGTGSGALAITAELELPGTNVFGVDINPHCLEVAQENANKHAANVEFLHSDLLSNLPITIHQSPITILANLPYVPDDYQINQAATHEPTLALFGGTDGLDLYRTIFAQLAELPNESITVLTESLDFQHKALEELAAQNGFTQKSQKDLIQVFTKN